MSNSPASMFQGFNKVTGAVLNCAVAGTTCAPETNQGVQSGTFLAVCVGYDELSKALHVSQSASVSLIGIGSGDESFDFFSSQQATSTSIHVVVSGVQVTEDLTSKDITSLKLPSGPSPKEIADFVAGYGDSYVCGLTHGAMFVAVYSFYCKTKAEITTVTASLTASGIIDGAVVSASMSATLQTIHQQATINTKYASIMYGVTGIATPSTDEIAQFAMDFPTLKSISPAVIGWTTRGYETVSHYTEVFKTVGNNRDLLSGNGRGQLGAVLPNLLAIINGITVMGQIYTAYSITPDDSLAPAMAVANTDLQSLQAIVAAYKTDPTVTLSLPATIPSLDKGMPEIEYSIDSDTCRVGVSNATASFDDAPMPRQLITTGTRLSSMIIEQDGFVYSIQAYYIDKDGNITAGTWCGQQHNYSQTFNIDGMIDKIEMSSRESGKFSSLRIHYGLNTSPWPFSDTLNITWNYNKNDGYFPLSIWGNCWGDNVNGPLVRLGFKLAKLTGVSWTKLNS